MDLPPVRVLAGALLLGIVPGQAGTLEKAPVNVQPSSETTPPWEITVEGPGWLAGVNGTIGTRGVTTHVDICFQRYLQANERYCGVRSRGPQG